MLKVLLAVDGSENALRAGDAVIRRAREAKGGYEVHLVNVQHPLHGGISTFVNQAQIKDYHHDEGMRALAPAREKFDAAGIPCEVHLFVGEPAQVIARYAREQGFDEIVIGTRGLTPVAGLVLGSVASKIVHLAEVPVLLVK
ncbi:MAG TPA: universal stress protein [Noviherbaspirillum sp.]|uniref:universal stress protein n=1 Tax=Noviherbaspirillum sp. TaxID=1926288 RepID=UPI002D3C789D|nr:universal stress protein [Noviherbaspirillum sp.]HYD93698.1 universal stress protein [Noviherbaspirillum sp.]